MCRPSYFRVGGNKIGPQDRPLQNVDVNSASLAYGLQPRACSRCPPAGKPRWLSEFALTAQVRIPWVRWCTGPLTSLAPATPIFPSYVLVYSPNQSIRLFYSFLIFVQCIASYGSVEEAHSSLTTSSVAITTITPLDHVVTISFIIHQNGFGQ